MPRKPKVSKCPNKSKKSGTRCSVNNCPSRTSKKLKISFFSYPTFISRRKVWIENCGTENLVDAQPPDPSKKCNFKVCSRHFEDHMFVNLTKKNRLWYMAVPTLFNDDKNKTPQSVCPCINLEKNAYDCNEMERRTQNKSCRESMTTNKSSTSQLNMEENSNEFNNKDCRKRKNLHQTSLTTNEPSSSQLNMEENSHEFDNMNCKKRKNFPRTSLTTNEQSISSDDCIFVEENTHEVISVTECKTGESFNQIPINASELSSPNISSDLSSDEDYSDDDDEVFINVQDISSETITTKLMQCKNEKLKSIRCCVPDCIYNNDNTSVLNQSDAKPLFYSAPSEIFKKWGYTVPFNPDVSDNEKYICERHFREEDQITHKFSAQNVTLKSSTLKCNARPTLNMGSVKKLVLKRILSAKIYQQIKDSRKHSGQLIDSNIVDLTENDEIQSTQEVEATVTPQPVLEQDTKTKPDVLLTTSANSSVSDQNKSQTPNKIITTSLSVSKLNTEAESVDKLPTTSANSSVSDQNKSPTPNEIIATSLPVSKLNTNAESVGVLRTTSANSSVSDQNKSLTPNKILATSLSLSKLNTEAESVDNLPTISANSSVSDQNKSPIPNKIIATSLSLSKLNTEAESVVKLPTTSANSSVSDQNKSPTPNEIIATSLPESKLNTNAKESVGVLRRTSANSSVSDQNRSLTPNKTIATSLSISKLNTEAESVDKLPTTSANSSDSDQNKSLTPNKTIATSLSVSKLNTEAESVDNLPTTSAISYQNKNIILVDSTATSQPAMDSNTGPRAVCAYPTISNNSSIFIKNKSIIGPKPTANLNNEARLIKVLPTTSANSSISIQNRNPTQVNSTITSQPALQLHTVPASVNELPTVSYNSPVNVNNRKLSLLNSKAILSPTSKLNTESGSNNAPPTTIAEQSSVPQSSLEQKKPYPYYCVVSSANNNMNLTLKLNTVPQTTTNNNFGSNNSQSNSIQSKSVPTNTCNSTATSNSTIELSSRPIDVIPTSVPNNAILSYPQVGAKKDKNVSVTKPTQLVDSNAILNPTLRSNTVSLNSVTHQPKTTKVTGFSKYLSVNSKANSLSLNSNGAESMLQDRNIEDPGKVSFEDVNCIIRVSELVTLPNVLWKTYVDKELNVVFFFVPGEYGTTLLKSVGFQESLRPQVKIHGKFSVPQSKFISNVVELESFLYKIDKLDLCTGHDNNKNCTGWVDISKSKKLCTNCQNFIKVSNTCNMDETSDSNLSYDELKNKVREMSRLEDTSMQTEEQKKEIEKQRQAKQLLKEKLIAINPFNFLRRIGYPNY